MFFEKAKAKNARVQMSEAFITSVFLALSGGFQDAYTYFTRDEVFSNAQTGNVVLMSQHFLLGEWQRAALSDTAARICRRRFLCRLCTGKV